MLALIPLLPFAGFVINVFFGRRLSKAASAAVACAAMIAAFATSLVAVWQLVRIAPEARHVDQVVFTWIRSGEFSAPAAFRLDPLAAVMILVVTGIGSLIHIYSTAYMHEEADAEFARYFSYLNLFAAFMLVLVLAANFLTMFVGWEGVGLCSYLLIGFWYQKKSAADAGKKAFIVNRIGDFGFILGVLFAYTHFGTLTFADIASRVAPLAPEDTFGPISWIALLLFIGATGKSAQIPLYVWLPDAMEGPTPVSALIHAATMVTAGVYMIGRNAALYSHAPEVLALVATIGALTALMAGTIGLVQNDIKRVLAYSTVSQLGYMFLAMGVGAYAAGIFHLYTHAFFKALLFLGSGAVIHALAGEQDLRRMGGLKKDLPVTYWTFLVGALAISGAPFLSGFFSKDEIVFQTFATGHRVLWLIAMVTSFLTATYMFRLFYLAFHGERAPVELHGAGAPGYGPRAAGHDVDPSRPAARSPKPGMRADFPLPHHAGHGAHLHDAPPAMALVLVVLAIGSIVAGYVGVPHILGGANRIERFLEPSFHLHATPAGEGVSATQASEAQSPAADAELSLTVFSVVVALAGIGIATVLFLRRRDLSDRIAARFAGLHRLLSNKYYVDEIYDGAIVQPVKILSREGLWKVIDARVIDGTVNGAGETVVGLAALIRRTQTGSVRAYAASVFFGVVLILGFYLWR